jgi:ABC-type glycerol-3-phosphate transport system substrate-binding protein
MSNPFKQFIMKSVKLFALAVVATVAFASCGGGATTEKTDSTAAVVDSVPATTVDTTTVAPADTTAADTTKKM